ncbi:MAG: hypothetical protein JSU00_29510 [Acidobacteria bacterium]|nr:hypothetical protein [Acidobacteriota bacterium]
MDTRSKIVSLETALGAAADRDTAVVVGYFDPLQLDHARRIAEIRASHECVIVALEDPPSPVLDARSRAQLSAAMDLIDYVVLPQECASSAGFERISHHTVYREEAADEARFQRLIDRTHRRQSAS